MKPKAKTLQERFGFHDEELRTPKHDEMMLWLDANIDSVAADLFHVDWTDKARKQQENDIAKARGTWIENLKIGAGLTEEEEKQVRLLVAEIKHWSLQNNPEKQRGFTDTLNTYLEAIAQGFRDPGRAPMRPTCKATERRWEYPIMDGRITVGFADYFAKVETFDASLDGPLNAPRWVLRRERVNLFFEVKPEIRSLGELMRQLNHYRVYTYEGQFFVVSPDDRFRSTLESQGIGFVKYTG